MLQKNILLILFLFGTLSSFSQEKVTLSGTIFDTKNKETLIGVNLYIFEAKASLTTNEYGFYSISLPKGDYTVSISYLGYQEISEKIVLSQNIKKNLKRVPRFDFIKWKMRN